MKEEYDFSNAHKNPYANRLKKQITSFRLCCAKQSIISNKNCKLSSDNPLTLGQRPFLFRNSSFR